MLSITVLKNEMIFKSRIILKQYSATSIVTTRASNTFLLLFIQFVFKRTSSRVMLIFNKGHVAKDDFPYLLSF